MAHRPVHDHAAIDIGDLGDADQRHGDIELIAHDLDGARHARLSRGPKTVNVGPPAHARSRAERQGAGKAGEGLPALPLPGDDVPEVHPGAGPVLPVAHRLPERKGAPVGRRGRPQRLALLGPDKPRRWGLSETGGVDIRRSALGVAEGGRTLLYGSGEWITPRALAEAMRAAGAVHAAELDVNWSFTRFLLYGPAPKGAAPEVTATLVPKTKHAPGLYVVKPSERDFFYLVRQGSQ